MRLRPLLLLIAGTIIWTLPAQGQSYYRPPSLDANRASFGGAVAISGDHVFIGEPQGFKDPGSIHVYQRSGDGWQNTAQVMASDGDVGDGFGQVFAVAEGVLLVGATQPGDGRGAVYVFDDAWMEKHRLTADDGAAGDQLGAALAFDGTYALVGAPRHNERAGAVYVFRQDAKGGWMQQAKLVGSDNEPNDGFGASIAMAEGRALISAPSHGAGAVYVFEMEDGAWTETGMLPADAQTGSGFGASIHLHGDHAFVGAPRANRFAGNVQVFHREAASGTWAAQGILESGEQTEGNNPVFFGAALGSSDSEVWVGAPFANDFAGALYRFTQDDDGAWTQVEPTLTNSNGGGRANYGGAFAVAGDLAVIGLSGADYGEGKALLLERNAAAGAWEEQAVLFNEGESLMPITGSQVDCEAGKADAYACSDVDLISFIPLKDMNIARGVRLNDVWGWTDPQSGKEYALVGTMEATVFVDISDPSHPVYLGQLVRTEGSPGSSWRDIKVYKDHAYIVADGAGEHGMQVFDLTQLREVQNPPVDFEVTTHYDKVHSVHNIVINEDTGFAYTVGSGSGGETCGGGLHMIDIREPATPTFVGCFADNETGRRKTGYSHDAQCVLYHGPDATYEGKEICFGANETAISISDVTDKENPAAISTGSYPDAAYVHQGWLSEDHRYFYQNDELDELNGKTERTRTLVWDVTDLDDPVLVKEFFGEASSTDHNLYVKGDLMYQTNNASGLRIIDISNPENPVEVGYFDTTPYGYNVAGFNGTWSSYPYFGSGVIVVTSRREGLFLVKKREVDI